jgi:hypothetical protein
MNAKERSIFLVDKYGEESLSIVESVLENNEDTQEKKYWTEVRNMCTILIKDKKQTNA